MIHVSTTLNPKSIPVTSSVATDLGHNVYRHRKNAETSVKLRNKMFVVFYSVMGHTTRMLLLGPNQSNYGEQISKGQCHGIEVIVPTAILKSKTVPTSNPKTYLNEVGMILVIVCSLIIDIKKFNGNHQVTLNLKFK